MKVSILIPVLNEASVIPTALLSLKQSLAKVPEISWEVILIDAGSSDPSPNLIRDFTSSFGWKSRFGNLKNPSIGKTLHLGLPLVTADYLLFLPIDLSLSVKAIQVWREALKQGATCGGFAKSYAPNSRLLKIYVALQNQIRSKRLRHLVWTNAIFCTQELAQKYPLPELGFLEDVLFSDKLRKEQNWSFVEEPIFVSSRRYYPSRVGKRILINAIIMLLFRLRLASPIQLKRLYAKAR